MSRSQRPGQAAMDPPTRQQLDDLDALMQRMLALPVDAPEDRAAQPEPANGRTASLPPPEIPEQPTRERKPAAEPSAPDVETSIAVAPLPPPTVAEGARRHGLLAPVVWCSRAFDAVLGPFGRDVLGFTGLLLAAAAILWLVLDVLDLLP